MILRSIASLVFCGLVLTGCAWQQQHTDVLSHVPLQRSLKVAVDGYYIAPNAGKNSIPPKGAVYVAPMDVSRVESDADACLPAMVELMQSCLTEEVGAALRDVCPNGGWTLTDDPQKATLIYRTALVRFRPQAPLLRGVVGVVSKFVDIPLVSRAVKTYAQGDICIEGSVRVRESDFLLMAFKDSNRETTSFYQAAAYRPTGNAEVNLRIWAKKMARFIYAEELMSRRGCSFEELLHERTVGETLKAYME